MDNITEELRKHYSEKFKLHGATSEGVDWGSDIDKVYLRYDNMLKLIEDKKKTFTLLDVGCGYGGLFEYANQDNYAIKYTGIDVAKNMIEWGKKKHEDVSFIHQDFLEYDTKKTYDYIVCNGILTQKLGVSQLDMEIYTKKMIKKMFLQSNVGIALNLMTTKVNFFSNNLFYKNPVELFAYCLEEITHKVKIDHSYPLYEYTVYLLK